MIDNKAKKNMHTNLKHKIVSYCVLKYQYSYACCIVLTIASFYVRIYVLLGTYSSFAQIILSPSTTGMKHSINANVCEEFVDALRQLGDDSECRAILVTGIGGAFCNGIDYTILANDTSADKQRKNAEALANGIKKLVKRVSYFQHFSAFNIHSPNFIYCSYNNKPKLSNFFISSLWGYLEGLTKPLEIKSTI